MTSANPVRMTAIDYETIPNITPEQAALATRRIAEHALDADDARELLDMAFGPPRRFHGVDGQRERRRGEAVSDVYQYPMPSGDAGKKYRAAVRTWGREQGLEVKTSGQPEGWLLNAYVEATGNVWDPKQVANDKIGQGVVA